MMLPIAKAFVLNINMENRKVSRSLVTLFTLAQIFTGFNFGFVKQMNNYKMAFYISIVTGIAASISLACSVMINAFWIIYAIQYFFTFLILIANKYTVYEFMLDSKMLTIELQEDFFEKHFGKIVWIYGFITFSFKFTIGAIYNWISEGEDFFIFRIIILISALALDIIPTALVLVFSHIYVKLKQLCLRFRNNNISVLEVQATYKAILDLMDKMRPTTDHLIVLGFAIDCPKWIQTTWAFLLLLKLKQSWLALGCSYAHAIHLTAQMCVPAVCAELVLARADALSTLIHNRLLVEQDDTTRSNLTRLVRYVRARPPLRKAWRLLPPGLKLPLAMLSMCTTALIVVIQSTHLYD